MRLGVHTGLQYTTTDELQALWRRIEELGFDWISIWDHFYSGDARFGADGLRSGTHSLEAVTTQTAVATGTTRVRCGSLVYCALYRHPAVLANTMATLDHLSHGRVTLGLGAGWHQAEFEAYGLEFPPPAVRLRVLEEAIQCVRLLLTEEVANFEGEHFRLVDAHCEPKPLQPRLPLWVGGGGEKVTLRIAATYADGWNVAFVPPDAYRHKVEVLGEHCARVGRDPSTIEKTVNLPLAWTEEDLAEQFAGIADYVRPAALIGSAEQMIDHIGQYADAGAETVIVALRAPFDVDALVRFGEEVLPAFG
ncbi:MAG TPA: TIGR03560 family F420-dependent LLM class oxidoreductase [Acidimicrobiia bacterium]|nr:TIGR03560 family F420-dependent LLM class oxidoreductase [Acidimicrobiia bacterium]